MSEDLVRLLAGVLCNAEKAVPALPDVHEFLMVEEKIDTRGVSDGGLCALTESMQIELHVAHAVLGEVGYMSLRRSFAGVPASFRRRRSSAVLK